MALLLKFLRNWTNLVSIVGIILVFGIILSGVDAMYILVVLGGMNCLYGLYAIVTKKPIVKSNLPGTKQNNSRYNMGMGICQLCMGIFVLVMGIVYINQIVTGKYFWDIVLVGIIIVMAFWYVMKLKAKKENG